LVVPGELEQWTMQTMLPSKLPSLAWQMTLWWKRATVKLTDTGQCCIIRGGKRIPPSLSASIDLLVAAPDLSHGFGGETDAMSRNLSAHTHRNNASNPGNICPTK